MDSAAKQCGPFSEEPTPPKEFCTPPAAQDLHGIAHPRLSLARLQDVLGLLLLQGCGESAPGEPCRGWGR